MKPQTKKRLTVLFADDGSQHAQAAVQFLKALPIPVKSKVFVLRVFTPSQGAYINPMEKELERTEQQLLESGFQAEKDLTMGYPAEKIVEVAESMKPDLIVVGAKGLRATLGILLGGVAQQVVEYACCPVLVVRAAFRRLEKLLLVTDGSQSSQRAANYLGKFPFPEQAEIFVLHALAPFVEPASIEAYAGGWHGVPLTKPLTEEERAEMIAKEEEEGKTLLNQTCDLLLKHGIKPDRTLLQGDAATEIIEYVKSQDIDLIVAGSRGLSSFQGWLLGSVSRKLVHYSGCSVLIVKSPKDTGP
jgi:nucleotide-binding universal stress UspA family protein